MKKILALCLIAVLSLVLVGCGNNNNDVVDDVDTPVHGNENQDVSNGNEEDENINNEIESGDENLGEVSGEVEEEVSGEKEEENKPVEDEKEEEKPVEDEKEEDKPVASTATATEMMTNLMTASKVTVNAPMQDVIPAEMSETYIGLTEADFTANVADSVFYESMISPANQSFCIVKVKDASKVDELKQKIFDNCNPRKWICMTAERVVVLSSGEYIMLAMASQDSCNALIPAFKAEFGEANVGTILDKTVSESIENFEGLPGADGGMAL